ncbi:MAG: DUF4142 domain-containing protein [Sphingomonadales bacterium]|nr:DUF4142 domain-containing protein [Sphingomonadales bacterium]
MKMLYFAGMALLLSACDNRTETTEDLRDETSPTMHTADGSMTPAASTVQPTNASGYVAAAGAGDLWEIESSRVLLAKSTNADVKKFAQMMIDQHQQSTDKFKAAAKTADMNVGAAILDSVHQQMLDEIKNADASAVDDIYLRNQRTVHKDRRLWTQQHR